MTRRDFMRQCGSGFAVLQSGFFLKGLCGVSFGDTNVDFANMQAGVDLAAPTEQSKNVYQLSVRCRVPEGSLAWIEIRDQARPCGTLSDDGVDIGTVVAEWPIPPTEEMQTFYFTGDLDNIGALRPGFGIRFETLEPTSKTMLIDCAALEYVR